MDKNSKILVDEWTMPEISCDDLFPGVALPVRSIIAQVPNTGTFFFFEFV